MHPLQPALRRFWPLVVGASALLLTACPGVSGNGNSGAPQITSFTASQTNVASGTPVTLSWMITGSPTSLSLSGSDGTNLSSLSGTTTSVTPTATTTYTLTASNSSGSDTATTMVTVGTGPVTPPGNSTLSFGVSNTQDGTFQNDAGSGITPGDPRIVNVAAGDTFYAQVTYSGPAPVTGVTIYLANRSPADLMADLVPGTDVKGFTLGSEVSGCATDGTQTSVTCTYPISVAAGTPNITALPGVSGEFAYVFRARVSDTTGATNMDAVRGYVTVGGSGGTTTGGTTGGSTTGGTTGTTTGGTTGGSTTGGTTTGGTTTGGSTTGGGTTGGSNKTPTADFTFKQVLNTLSVQFDASGSKDSDGKIVGYEFNFGDGGSVVNTGNPVYKRIFPAADTYDVTLKVTDDGGATASVTKSVTVAPVDAPSPSTFTLQITQPNNETGKYGNVRLSPSGEKCGIACNIYGAGKEVTLKAVTKNGSSFLNWGGACSPAGTSTTCVLTMDGNKNVIANFSTP